MHQSPWAQYLTTSLPSKRDKTSSKAGRQSCPGAKLIFTSIFQAHRNMAGYRITPVLVFWT
jgi:hypothetical protein